MYTKLFLNFSHLPVCRKPTKLEAYLILKVWKDPQFHERRSTNGMLEGNIPTLEAPHTTWHKQPSTISNYEKWEKKRSLHQADRASATPPTKAPKSKVLNTVFRLQGDGFRLQARATSSISSPIICWCLAPRTAFLDSWMLHWRDNSKSTDQMIFTHLAVVDFSDQALHKSQ